MIELSLFEQTGRLSVYQWTAYLLPLCHFTAAALNAALDWLARLVTDEKEDWDLRLCAANTLLDFPRASYRPLLEALAVRQKERMCISPTRISRKPMSPVEINLTGCASRIPGSSERQEFLRMNLPTG